MVVIPPEGRKPLSPKGEHVYYNTKKGDCQMLKKNFWFLTLCVFLLISVNMGLNIPLRVAIAANAVVILIDVAREARRLKNGGNEA